MDIIRRMLRLLRPYRRSVAVALSMQLVMIATRLTVPYLTRSVVNDVIGGGRYELLMWLCAAILVLALVRASFGYTRATLMERASQGVAFELRTGLFRHLEEMPYSFYDTHRIGEIMSRLTGDLEGVRNMIAGGLVQLVESVTFFVGSLVFMAFMSARLTLVMMCVAPVLGVVAYQFNKRIRPAFAAIREQNAALNTRTQENLAGVRVVKAFAREEHERQLFADENGKLLKLHLRATRIWATFNPIIETISGLCTPLMLLFGGGMVLRGTLDLGTMVGVTGYIWMITSPVRQMSPLINMIAQSITSAEKLFYYQDLGANIRDAAETVEPEARLGAVRLDHVDFTYGDGIVLRDINLEVKPGQSVAIMGATGSGKTTLTALLGRFYDVTSGRVLVDGVDVREQKLESLRASIGYVMQETFLYSDTLFDNIRYGRPEASLEDARLSARVAQAEEFIEHMPQGYETIVGERGLGLSGGQKQRVAIARAVLIDPRILVLDDSTSAVDMETEHEIQEALKEVMRGRTTFIIAHRISSVKNADQIIVLEGGAIAERGTHGELMAQRGLYYQMFVSQYQDYERFALSKAGEE